MKRGRPTKYKPEFAKQAEKLYNNGAIDREVADYFGVSEPTLNSWKTKFPDFLSSLKIGKEASDNRVEKSLYSRALGYSHDAVKIVIVGNRIEKIPYVERYPPDTAAAIFWLKNRKPNEWKDIKAVHHSGDLNQRNIQELSDNELQEIATGRGNRALKTKGSQEKIH